MLFLCTGNSARSQIAEALLQHLSGGVMAFSAGSHPKSLHPDAVRVMAEHGIDLSGRRAKHVDEFTGQRFTAVVTLCDRVRVKGAGAGAGAAVAAVAVQAGSSLIPASWRRAAGQQQDALDAVSRRRSDRRGNHRPWLVLVLLTCGLVETVAQRARPAETGTAGRFSLPLLAAGGFGGGVLLSIAWVALKVGALSYGGGFVIIPLMQADAVDHYHWMSDAQFLNAVALGQITPGPVVQTVAVVGYAAVGIGGGLRASTVAFTPPFAFILLGAHRFDRLRANQRVRAFLDGAGPAAIGAILGSAILLATVLTQPWQYAIRAGAAILLLPLRRGVVPTLLAAGTVGVIIALAGGPLPH